MRLTGSDFPTAGGAGPARVDVSRYVARPGAAAHAAPARLLDVQREAGAPQVRQRVRQRGRTCIGRRPIRHDGNVSAGMRAVARAVSALLSRWASRTSREAGLLIPAGGPPAVSAATAHVSDLGPGRTGGRLAAGLPTASGPKYQLARRRRCSARQSCTARLAAGPKTPGRSVVVEAIWTHQPTSPAENAAAPGTAFTEESLSWAPGGAGRRRWRGRR